MCLHQTATVVVKRGWLDIHQTATVVGWVVKRGGLVMANKLVAHLVAHKVAHLVAHLVANNMANNSTIQGGTQGWWHTRLHTGWGGGMHITRRGTASTRPSLRPRARFMSDMNFAGSATWCQHCLVSHQIISSFFNSKTIDSHCIACKRVERVH